MSFRDLTDVTLVSEDAYLREKLTIWKVILVMEGGFQWMRVGGCLLET